MKSVLGLLAPLAFAFVAATGSSDHSEERRVNILLVTVDDMNWNSVGAFGNPISDITPNIDRLAKEGRRYERAYVAAANCAPSRVAIQTGLYPQQSGATGFFYIDDTEMPSIAGELRRKGFLTGVINKSADTNASPNNEKYWDFRAGFGQAEKYSASAYARTTARFFDRARDQDQPFYLLVNIADPHKPNFNDRQAVAIGADAHLPSRVIAETEVDVPAFLPDLPKVRRDVRNYYNSVRRADDALGKIMQSLRESGLEDSTLIVFLSDHGMPFPFAKSSVYDNGLRTPLVMKWTGRIEPGSVDTGIVSVVDLMPTILDAAGVKMPSGQAYQGRVLLGDEPASTRKYAFGSFDENAKGYPVPMRGVISSDWGYVFNAWSDGEHTIKVADMNHLSFKQMQRHAQKDPAIKARFDFFMHRSTEELCHLKVDPDCLVNLADDLAHAGVLAEMRGALRAQMVSTDDYLLDAFDVRGDRAKLQAFMRRQHAAAKERATSLRWKRDTNIAGKTRSNEALFRKDQP